MRTGWILTNVGQWLNRFPARIESYFLLCIIFYLAGFLLVGIGEFPAADKQETEGHEEQVLLRTRELTDSNQQEPSQIENYAKQKVRLNSSQKTIQPLANIC